MPSDLDFTGKTVLVVGGSSGIGNGIAHGFRRHGAEVHVWGTRAKASDYKIEEGSDLDGLHYAQMDVSNFVEVETFRPNFRKLDVLVLSQGTVIYKRGEFQMDEGTRVSLCMNVLLVEPRRFVCEQPCLHFNVCGAQGGEAAT